LVGIGLEGLIPSDEAPEQLELGAPERGWREAVEAMDKALERFGKGSIRPARLIDADGDDG